MIFDATPCQLGEGPLWHPTRGQLFWCDILGQRLHTKDRHWNFDMPVSAAGWVDDATLLLASSRALHRFDIATGKTVDLCALEADNSVTRSNDGRADPQGGFWIGTMGRAAEPQAGAIWRYYKGTLRKLFANITISNAICFAPDGRCAYFTDTPSRKIMRVTLGTDGWPDSPPQTAIDMSGTENNPDGAVVDAAGNLWIALWGRGCVAGYTPAGDFIHAIDFPASQTTCPAFGGPALQDLYCTSAADGLPADAHQGRTFRITTKTTGQAEHRVLL